MPIYLYNYKYMYFKTELEINNNIFDHVSVSYADIIY